MFVPLPGGIAIRGKDIAADAPLTQRELAAYLVRRGAHYHFTVKGNQATLQPGIALLFQNRKEPGFVEVSKPARGRIGTRRIWCGAAPSACPDFPHAGQVFLIGREAAHKKSGKVATGVAPGMTSRHPEQAGGQRILEINRGHRAIGNRRHYAIDWNFDEDRCRIRTGCGPENISRLRRFAAGIIQFISDGKSSVAQKMQQLNRNTRLVFDCSRMTNNSTHRSLA